MTTKPFHLWIDLETTGLDERAEEAQILEVAMVTTTVNTLEIIAEASDVVRIYHSKAAALRLNNPEVWRMHKLSGLLDECLSAAAHLLWNLDAFADSLNLSRSAPMSERPVVCGNTIGFDRRWLAEHAPGWLDARCHYRSIDVSTVKELARHWAPEVVAFWEQRHPKASAPHRALADVKQSIAELRYYRECNFIDPCDARERGSGWSYDALECFAARAEMVK